MEEKLRDREGHSVVEEKQRRENKPHLERFCAGVSGSVPAQRRLWLGSVAGSGIVLDLRVSMGSAGASLASR